MLCCYHSIRFTVAGYNINMIKNCTGIKRYGATEKEAVFVQEPAQVISTLKKIQGHLQTAGFITNSPEEEH